MSALSSQIFEGMVKIRRELHQAPELSGNERATAKRIGDFLRKCGVRCRTVLSETGIIAELPGKSTGPFIVLRADTDALPIVEETNLPFASTHHGIMHACGHDGHTAMLLGTAALLSQEELPAPVRLIFQPAEETGSGAMSMIEEGALDHAGMIFGGHLDRHYEAGVIIVTEGAVNASADKFHIEITGQGAHGARPHESIDAVVVGSLMVMALQTIVSREVDPAYPSVVSVGLFHAGTASNVIAGQARLEGTIRSQDPKVRSQLQAAVKRIAEAIAQLHGAKINVAISLGSPPVINTPAMAQMAREAAVAAVGEANVVPLRVANMGGEDFSYYLEHIPGAYVRFGGQVLGRESFPAHSSKFDFDEQALAIGACYFRHIALLAGSRLAEQHTKTVLS